MNSVPYVVAIASPALLLAIAVDAFRFRRARPLESAAWAVMALALIVAVVYPALVDMWVARTGIALTVSVVGFVGIAAAFIGYSRQSARIRELESTVSDLRNARAVESGTGTVDGPVPGESAESHDPTTPRGDT